MAALAQPTSFTCVVEYIGMKKKGLGAWAGVYIVQTPVRHVLLSRRPSPAQSARFLFTQRLMTV